MNKTLIFFIFHPSAFQTGETANLPVKNLPRNLSRALFFLYKYVIRELWSLF